MRTKHSVRNKILAAVHETAQDLYAAGFIDMRRMRTYDALCLQSTPPTAEPKSAHCALATN
jgi:putative transcriptional regulator